MPRRSRRLAKLSDDDEFETEIFKEFNAEKLQSRRVNSDSDDDDNSDCDEEEEVDSSDEDQAAVNDDDEDEEDEDLPHSAHLVLQDPLSGDDVSDNNSDSDEEPESVGFQDSRAAALVQMQQILADMKKEKAKKKTQQQEIEQRNRIQKAKKTKRLKRQAAEMEAFDDVDQSQEEQPAVETKDFIPLSSKKPRKAVISKQVGLDTVQVLGTSAAGPVKEEVVNFRNQMLFSRNVRRVSTQKVIQQRSKRMIIQGRR